MENTENRFKLKLPLAQNPLTQKLLGNILKITDDKLPLSCRARLNAIRSYASQKAQATKVGAKIKRA